jgi:hypothetical protein
MKLWIFPKQMLALHGFCFIFTLFHNAKTVSFLILLQSVYMTTSYLFFPVFFGILRNEKLDSSIRSLLIDVYIDSPYKVIFICKELENLFKSMRSSYHTNRRASRIVFKTLLFWNYFSSWKREKNEHYQKNMQVLKKTSPLHTLRIRLVFTTGYRK